MLVVMYSRAPCRPTSIAAGPPATVWYDRRHLGGAAVPIETIAVIGSGIMGRGIAHAAAVGGFRAVLHAVAAEALDRALAHIRRDLDEGVARGKLAAADAAAA